MMVQLAATATDTLVNEAFSRTCQRVRSTASVYFDLVEEYSYPLVG